MENQLTKPLLRIFEPILGDSRAKQELLSKPQRCRLVYKLILYTGYAFSGGTHTMSKTVTSSSGHGMLARFAKKKSTCIGCRAVLDEEGKA